VTQLKIKKEFKNLIPPLSDEEYHGLTESILTHGCRDTIKIWRGFIVDGHNRYEICQKHGIPYKTQKLRFSSKENAALWIVENQLGRRNLTDVMRIKLAIRKGEYLRDVAMQSHSKTGCEPIHVRKTIAKDAKVSEQTVYRFMKVEKQGDLSLLAQIENGEISISSAYNNLTGAIQAMEVIYDENNIPDLRDPLSVRAIAIKTERIIKLYRFIFNNVDYINIGEDRTPMLKKLSAQLESACGVKAWILPP